MNVRYHAPQSRGFTLIELLVVISIIGLLASIIVASLNTAETKANDSQRLTNLRSVQTALELYATKHNGQYPSTSQNFTSSCSGGSNNWNNGGSITQNNAVPNIVTDGDIATLPLDPQVNSTNGTCCYLYAGTATDYKYEFFNCPTSIACYGSTEQSSGLADPVHTGSGSTGSACSVYTPGAVSW